MISHISPKRFIYTVRSESWLLLLECIREIIPFTFAYNHINYARYLTPMLGDMLKLEIDFPQVYMNTDMNSWSQVTSQFSLVIIRVSADLRQTR